MREPQVMAELPPPIRSRARAYRTRRYILGVLLAFAALNAFGGGYYGMAGAEGVPVEWLQDTPFTDYFVPSLILFVVVGGSFLAAALACFTGHRSARTLSFIAIAIVLLWLAVQVLMIGHVSWMQPATAIYSALLFLVTMGLPSAEREVRG